MMWRFYRPKIISIRLIPFFFYLIAMNFIVIFGQDFIDELMNVDEDHLAKKLTKHTMYLVIISSCCLIQIYWLWNIRNECNELLREGWDYLKDIWNYLDIAISIMTQLFLTQFMTDLIS